MSADLLGRTDRAGRSPLAVRSWAPPAGRVPARLVVLLAVLGAAAAAVAVLTVSWWGGGLVAPSLADPGPLVRWGTPLARAALDLAAVGTVGVLATAALVLPAEHGRLGDDAAALLRAACRWATGWVVAAAAGTVLTLSEVAGRPVLQVLRPDVLPLVLEVPQTRALLSSAWLAGLVVVFSSRARTPAGSRLALLGAGAALLPVLLNAHAAHEDAHVLGTAALAVHVLAASVWVGGLLALVVHLRCGPAALRALPRFSAIALVCVGAVAASGVVTAATLLEGPAQLASSPYGRLLVLKAVVLGVLAASGHLHRRRSLPAAAAGRRGVLLRVAAVELLVMGLVVGLAAGLARTEPPAPGHAAPAATATVLASPA